MRYGQERNTNISHLRVFGYDAYAFIISKKRKKLNKRYEKCIFVGYDNQHIGYRIYSPYSIAEFISRDVNFNELIEESASYEGLNDLDESFVSSNWLDVIIDKSP